MRGKGGKGWRKGNRQEGGRDRDVGVSHGKVPPTSCHSATAVVLGNQWYSQAQRRRGKGLLTTGPRVFVAVVCFCVLFCFLHSLALEGGQNRKQGTQRVPASLKDIEAQLTGD